MWSVELASYEEDVGANVYFIHQKVICCDSEGAVVAEIIRFTELVQFVTTSGQAISTSYSGC